MKITVMGAGSWGTALALQLARNGHEVWLWGHRAEHMEQLQQQRENKRYLPNVCFPENLHPTTDIKSALNQSAFILLVVPSHSFSETLLLLENSKAPVVWAIKGFIDGRLLSEVFRRFFPERPFAILTGPSFAKEVANGMPTAVTIASDDENLARELAGAFHGNNFICYTSNDVLGVQIGGAVKNVIAIATGIADGCGCGANARAALITRGLKEISRLNEALGGKAETLAGLSGMGDLVLTCTDNQSRNRRFGLALGNGKTPEDAKKDIGQTVEGEGATHDTWILAQRFGLHMPITEHLHLMLSGQMDLRELISSLLARQIKSEQL